LAALAVILLLTLLFFRWQLLPDEPLKDALRVHERVSQNETEDAVARTNETEESLPIASVSCETQKLPAEVDSADLSQNGKMNKRQAKPSDVVSSPQREIVPKPYQIKEPARQNHEMKNGQDLSKFMPTADEIDSANRFVNLGGKVEFFGICTPCEHVAFLIDSSGSMKGPRFDRVRVELLKSLSGLKQSQRFSIYLFKSSTVYKRKNCVVSPAEINNIRQELNRLYACGGTDPTEAIKEAVDEQSDVIFLLSDGKIRQSGKDIARLNRRRKIINTIAIGGDSQSLRDVAKENGGEYRKAQ